MRVEKMVILTRSEIDMMSTILNRDDINPTMPLYDFGEILRDMEIQIGLMKDFITPIHEALCPTSEYMGLHSMFFRARQHLD